LQKTEKLWIMEEAIDDALARHGDCDTATAYQGMAFPFSLTWVVKLWRNVECFEADDPPKYVEEGYPQK
jgi:hypothetical protein